MKPLLSMLLPILMAVALVRCAREETEEVVVQPEEMPAEVAIPDYETGRSVFVQMTGEGFQAEADLLAESIRNRVSRHDGLAALDPGDASASSADFVLEGRIEKAGGQLEVVTVLRDQEGAVLSDQHYLEDPAGLIRVSEEIGARTVAALDPDAAGPRSEAVRDIDPHAVQLYVRSKAFLAEQSHAGADRAIAGFKQAVRQDSDFVPAWLGLARAYLMIFEEGWNRNLVWLELAQKSAIRTIQLDSLQAEAYQVMGRVHQLRGDDLHAEPYFRKALDLHPRLAPSWAGLGGVFSKYGLYEPALEAYGHAVSIRPDDPAFALNYAMLLIGLKRYEEARSVLERAVRMRPEAVHLKTFLALACYYLQDYSNASDAVQEGLSAPKYQPLAHAVRAMILCKNGRWDDALAEVELEVKPAAGGDASLMTAAAAVYALLGRDGLAVQWLEKAADAGYREVPWIANDPNFSGLRDDPRYRDLMTRLNGLWKAQVRDYFEREG